MLHIQMDGFRISDTFPASLLDPETDFGRDGLPVIRGGIAHSLVKFSTTNSCCYFSPLEFGSQRIQYEVSLR